jgi:hypothetical protein
MMVLLLSNYSKQRLLLLFLLPPFRPLARLRLWFTVTLRSLASLDPFS